VAISVSRLRQDIYRILDRALATGIPVEIIRKGRRLSIVPESRPSRLARLLPHPGTIVGDPDDLLRVDWSSEWRPFLGQEEEDRS